MGFNLHADGTNDPSEVRKSAYSHDSNHCLNECHCHLVGYDTSVIGGTMALDSFRQDFDLADSSPVVRDTLQGNIVSTFQAGCFFGALLMFPMAEWLGRKKAIMISALVFLVGRTFMTASHGEIGLLIAGRAIAGLGIAPPSIRGRLIGLFEIASQGGGMCGFWVNYAVDRTISDSTQTQWIVPLGLQLLPGVLLFFGIFICPESPRWLAKNDSTKLFATGFYGIAKTLGMVIFNVWLAEKVGRRNGLIWGAFVGSLPMWYIGGFTFLADPAGQAAAGNTDRNAWGYIAMVCVYLYGLIYCATWQGITWLYCSEVFGLDIRMLCVAITTADQWLWSFISRTTPYTITSLGYGTYMFFGALMILMGVWAFFFVPETKGLTLEDMDLLFMRSMHTTVWTALRERKSVKDVLADTSPAAVYATGSEEKEIRLEYVDTVEDNMK
ncbi:hypothetical protein BDP81DRAFT_455530 [Colletotrichum phormii]|uniref:Quinate permease n=1 Tax=Colletotrichum phormii TaxID=359342 RepID=A0AAJ0E882_9PEZI|nr:uncharacterized protein BDP81DRAFT_455530 [Colletotrichum phormii]KAK1622321.1 hypothetical protein BDP81DRAFT_455530 [Colletotrichum phormii]